MFRMATSPEVSALCTLASSQGAHIPQDKFDVRKAQVGTGTAGECWCRKLKLDQRPLWTGGRHRSGRSDRAHQ